MPIHPPCRGLVVLLTRRLVHIHECRGSPLTPHSYLRKFVRVWDKGRLSSAFFFHNLLTIHIPLSVDVSSDRGAVPRRNSNGLRRARANKLGYLLPFCSAPGGAGGVLSSGPRCHRHRISHLRERLHQFSEHQASERDPKRKRARADIKERLEDVVGPKEVGLEGMLAKKRARRESDRAFLETGDDGYEVNESLGGGDSFPDRWVFCIFLRACLTSQIA